MSDNDFTKRETKDYENIDCGKVKPEVDEMNCGKGGTEGSRLQNVEPDSGCLLRNEVDRESLSGNEPAADSKTGNEGCPDKPRRKEKHRLLKIPVLCAVLWGMFFLSGEFIGSVIGQVIATAIKADAKTFPVAVPVDIIAIIFIIIFNRHYRPDYRGMTGGGRLFTGVRLVLPTLVVVAVSLAEMLITKAPLYPPSLYSISLALMAGLCEESAFRGGAVPIMMKGWKFKESRVIPALCITAAAFALVHSFNVFAGVKADYVIIQVITALGIGIAYGAIYIRCGNILPLMAAHFIHDAVLFSGMDITEGLGSVTEIGLYDYISTIIIAAAFTAYGFFLVRKEKRKEICELWKNEWSERTE